MSNVLEHAVFCNSIIDKTVISKKYTEKISFNWKLRIKKRKFDAVN
jgi:hypothetical protein